MKIQAKIIDIKLVPYAPVVDTEIVLYCYLKGDLQLIQVFDHLPITKLVLKYGIIEERHGAYNLQPVLYRNVLLYFDEKKQSYVFDSFSNLVA